MMGLRPHALFQKERRNTSSDSLVSAVCSAAKMIRAGDGENYFKCHATGSTDFGDKWDDGAGGHVKHILICHDENQIRSIQTTYERQGNMLLSRRHGVSGGDVDVITFSEPLTSVSGRCGLRLDRDTLKYYPVVRSLKFATDYETYGPFGCDSGEDDRPFHFKTSTWIGGLHGCSRGSGAGGCLSTIGVYIWSPQVSLLDKPPSPPAGKSAAPPRGRS